MKSPAASVTTEIAKSSVRSVIALTLYLDAADGGTTRYVNQGEDLTYDGNLYQAVGFEIDEVKTESSLQVASMVIRVNDVEKSLLASVLTSFVELRGRTAEVVRIYPDISSHVVLFKGPIDKYRSSETLFELIVKSSVASLRQRGPRGSLDPSCRWTLGGDECSVDMTSADNKYVGTATAGSTTEVTDTSTTNDFSDYWSGGRILMTSGLNNGKQRVVSSYAVGGVISLEIEFPFAVQIGDTFELYRGCDRTIKQCGGKFDNRENFGGFPSLPREAVKL